MGTGYMNCWKCGPMKVVVFIALVAGISEDEAGRLLYEYRDGKKIRETKKEIIRGKRLHPPIDLGPLRTVHKEYLRERNFNPKALARDWNIQGTGPLAGKDWRWRVVFEIANATGKVVGYGGRAIYETKKRYMMSKDGDCLESPHSFLYGIERVPKHGKVIVVEGPTGVWRLGAGSVATLGSTWRPEQAWRLRRYAERYIMFDPEPLAQEHAQRLADWLALFPGHTEIIEVDRQPGELTNRAARRIKKVLLGRLA